MGAPLTTKARHESKSLGMQAYESTQAFGGPVVKPPLR